MAGRRRGRFRPRRGSVDAPARVIPFELLAPDIPPGALIPRRLAEDSRLSPRLRWSGVPADTRAFALAVTDPDPPAAFAFPQGLRALAGGESPGR